MRLAIGERRLASALSDRTRSYEPHDEKQTSRKRQTRTAAPAEPRELLTD